MSQTERRVWVEEQGDELVLSFLDKRDTLVEERYPRDAVRGMDEGFRLFMAESMPLTFYEIFVDYNGDMDAYMQAAGILKIK